MINIDLLLKLFGRTRAAVIFEETFMIKPTEIFPFYFLEAGDINKVIKIYKRAAAFYDCSIGKKDYLNLFERTKLCNSFDAYRLEPENYNKFHKVYRLYLQTFSVKEYQEEIFEKFFC